MKRSSHVAIKLPASQVQAAAKHYRTVLGLEVASREEPGVHLVGPNFHLWIDHLESETLVLQEFVAEDAEEARLAHLAAGCEIFDESEFGFHVRDPYGMHYHVWTKVDEPG